MSARDGMVVLDVAANTAPFERSMSRLQSSVNSIGRKMAAVLSVAAVTSFGKQCVELASNLNEVQNVVDVTFKTMNKQVDEWAKNAAGSFGLSETMAKRYVGTFGSMAEAFGFTEKEAYDMSTALTGLAGDVASFYNISQDEAYTKLKSVFSGETETLKELGIVMTQNALDAYALANGYGKVTKDMTEQEKVALRLAFVQGQLANASGDFARTSESWANQTRLLALNFDSLRATIGQSLIAALLPVVKVMNGIIVGATQIAQAFNSLVEQITGKSMAELTGGAQSTGAALVDLGDISEDSAGSAADLADAQQDAAKAADTQNKAQKALNRTLAGFDKINKLQSKQAKEAAQAAKAAGSSTPSIEVGGAGAAAKALKDVNKQAGLLSKIKLPPALEKAFKRLKTAVKGFVGMVKGGLQWVYNNVLKPLGKWTLNKLLPKVVRLLATALKLLKAAAEALAPIFKAMWEVVFKPLAKFAGKVVIAMINGITKALEGLAKFAKNHPKAFSAIAIGLAALFGVHKTGLKFSNMGFKVGQALGVLAKTKLGTKVTKLGGALKGVFNLIKRHPVAAVILAIAAAVLAVYKNWDKIKKTKIGQALTRLGTALKPIFEKAVDLGSKVLSKIAEWVGKIYDKLKPYLDKLLPFLESVGTAIIDGIAAAINWLAGAIEKASPFIQSIVEWIGDKLKAAADVAKIAVDALKGAWDAIKNKTATLIAEAKEKVAGAIQAIKDGWAAIKDKAASLIAEAKEKVSGAIQALKDGWESIKDRVANLAAQVATKWADIKAAWNNIVGNIKDKVANLKAQIATKWNQLRKAWNNIVGNIKNKVAEFKGAIKQKWADLKQKWFAITKNIARKIVEFKGAIKQKWAELKAKWHNITQHIKKKVAEFKGLIKQKWADLKAKWHNLIDHIKDKIADFKARIATKWADLKEKWNNLCNNLQTVWVEVKAWIASKWSDLKDAWNSLISNFGDVWATVTLTIGTTFESARNFINEVIDGINSKLQGLYWPDWVPGIGGKQIFSSGPLPKFYAQGGWVARNTPQLAVIGDNRREGEIVSPESKLQAMADRAAANGGNMSTVEDLLRQLIEAVNAQDRGVYLDGRDISRAVVRNVNKQTQATGRCPIVV